MKHDLDHYTGNMLDVPLPGDGDVPTAIRLADDLDKLIDGREITLEGYRRVGELVETLRNIAEDAAHDQDKEADAGEG